MQSLNDDMDRLFRRAAEGYPLDTDSADWDKVQSMLAQDTAVLKPDGRDRRKLLWLLLLLPLGFLCNTYVYNGLSNFQKQPLSSVKKEQARTQPGSAEARQSSVDLPFSTKQQEPVNPQQPESKDIKNKEASTIVKISIVKGITPGSTTSFLSNRKERTSFTMLDNIRHTDPQKSIQDEPFVVSSSRISNAPLPHLLAPSQYLYKTWRLNPLFTENKTDSKKQQKSSPKRFYAGLMGGIDATTIKMQKVDALGYSAGLLLGYDLGRKWSLETGLFMDKKFYYTKGEYFSKSHLYMPTYYTLTTVTGDCRMWEIPVTAKYTIRQTATSSFFSTAGASSYFMKKESYDYDYKNINTGWEGSYYKSYTNSSNRFFSVVHLSAGYTHHLGRVGDLRIEPYIKIPVQKVGIGQMPITSGGIQFGITRRLF